MCGIIDCKDHTPEQKKVVEDFNKLIASKLKEAKSKEFEEINKEDENNG